MTLSLIRRFTALSAMVVASTTFASRAEGAVFTAQGVFSDGSLLSGTVTIDTIVGVFTAINMVVGPPNRTFSENIDQGDRSAPWFYSVNVRNTDATEDFGFGLPLHSLVGYTGGAICSLSTIDCVPSNLYDLVLNQFGAGLNEGSLSLALEGTLDETPEPATAVLLAPVLAGLWMLRRRWPVRLQ